MNGWMSLDQEPQKRSDLFEIVPPAQWQKPKLSDFLSRFQKQSILILGDLGVDRYTQGDVERISPEAPVPIVKVQSERLKLGLAANVADNISDLGGQCQVVGIVGEDRSHEDFRTLMEKKKLSTAGLIQDPSRRTVVKERIVSVNQQLLRIDYETDQPLSEAIERSIIDKVETLLPTVGALIIEDYAKGLVTERIAQSAIEIARANKKLILVDPNAQSEMSLYHHAGVLTPNLKEAEMLGRKKITDSFKLYEVGQDLLENADAQTVIITLGKDGMALFEREREKAIWMPTVAKDVFDVSGAGDTVIATLTLALLSGASPCEAAILANCAGGLVVAKPGTATTSITEIQESLNRF